MQKSIVSKPDSLLLLEMELLVSLILLEKTCIFVNILHWLVPDMWCCNLHTIRNVNILQEISWGILNTEKSWEMGNQRTFRDKTACRKFYTFCLLIFLRNWRLPYKEWDRRIHSNWKVKNFLSNSSKDTHAIAIVNCI